MFARLKAADNGRVYVQVVHSYRRQLAGGRSSPRQKVVATVGRVDHLTDREREDVIAHLTYALTDIRATGQRRRLPWEIQDDEAAAALRERRHRQIGTCE